MRLLSFRQAVVCASCALIIVLASVPAFGLDIETVLQALDKVEADLQLLVEHETSAREQQLAALEERIAAVAATDDTRMDMAEIKAIQHEMAALRSEVERLMAATEISDMVSVNEQIQSLSTELAEMRRANDRTHEMVMQLREADGVSQPVLASTESGIGSEKDHLARIDPHLQAHGESHLEGLEISAFFDALGVVRNGHDDKTNFSLNQAEVDLIHALSDEIETEVWVMFEGDHFGVGAAFVTFNPYTSEHDFLRSASITAGQFDVPFGIDYLVIASPDRKFITVPRAVEGTHESWNDLGIQFGLESSAGNLVVYGVNGFESLTHVLDEEASITAGHDVYEEIETTPANAFGMRLGGTPTEDLEIGASIATGLNSDGENEVLLWGGDIQWSTSAFEIKGEWLYRSAHRSIKEEINRGWYLQGAYNLLDRAFVIGRYGSFKEAHHEWTDQVSIGGGYRLMDGVELRYESVINEHSAENQNIVQVVVSF